MIKIFKVIIILYLCFFNNNLLFAKKLSAPECMEIASMVNENMAGMKIDVITTITTTFCLPKGKQSQFIYKYSVNMDGISVSDVKSIIPAARAENINTWCTDPKQKIVIKQFHSVVYKYYSEDGSYLAEYIISEKDCR